MMMSDYIVSSSDVDRRIEALVAKRLMGEWTPADDEELDLLVSLRGAHLIPNRGAPARKVA